jgi:L-fuconolactonase
MIRLDAHQHFWKYNPRRDAWITDDMAAIQRDFLPVDLEGTLAANGFDGCVAVQADQSLDETSFCSTSPHGIPSSRASSAGWICGRRDSTRRSRRLRTTRGCAASVTSPGGAGRLSRKTT